MESASDAGIWGQIAQLLQIVGHFSFLGALIVFVIGQVTKRRRMRSAIRTEIEMTTAAISEIFLSSNLAEMLQKIEADPGYRPIYFTSDRHVVIGNLNDDIAYFSKNIAAKILAFNDDAEFIDDCMRFIRSEDFLSVDLERKKKALEAAFSRANDLQEKADVLLEDL